MTDQNKWILIAALVLPGLILITIGFLIHLSNKKKNGNGKEMDKTKGSVIGYSKIGNDGVYPPELEFFVEGHSYKTKLRYQSIKVVEGSFIKGTTIKGDPLDKSLSVKRNSHLSFNPLTKAFPVGTTMTIYYERENPKNNYVERPTKNFLTYIFIGAGLFTFLVSAIISYFT